jgi:DNA-binding CsgD family transcriptional regulator
MRHRLGAEGLGTFWLVFAGCGSAVLAASFTNDSKFPLGIGFLGVALAFGLSVMTMAYAVGHVSGGPFSEVLNELARGATYAGIASSPFVSENTVKTHVSSLCGKLAVSRRSEALAVARNLHLI